MTASHDSLLTMADAAKALGMSKTALGRLARNGLVHEVKKGRLSHFYRSEIMHVRKIRDHNIRSKDICDDLLILKFTLRRIKELTYHVSERLEIEER